MGKRLINKNQLQEGFDRQTMCFVVTKDMILSQSAMDFAREFQIRLVPASEKNSQSALVSQVKQLLLEGYGIRDEKILNAVLAKITK